MPQSGNDKEHQASRAGDKPLRLTEYAKNAERVARNQGTAARKAIGRCRRTPTPAVTAAVGFAAVLPRSANRTPIGARRLSRAGASPAPLQPLGNERFVTALRICRRFGMALDVAAVRLHIPTGALILQLDVQHMAQAFA